MWQYLLKRLLAMIPTLLGVLTLTFLVTQFVPGGPVEHALTQLDGESARSGAEGASQSGTWSYSGRQRIDHLNNAWLVFGVHVQRVHRQTGIAGVRHDRQTVIAMKRVHQRFETLLDQGKLVGLVH